MIDNVEITTQEIFELIKVLNTLNDYTKKNMSDDNPLIIREGEVYVIDNKESLYAIRGKLVLDEKKIPNISKWFEDKTVVLKNREVYEFKKDLIKNNLLDTEVYDDKIIINYVSKSDEIEKRFIIEHLDSFRITNIVDRINSLFDKCGQSESEIINIDYDSYKDHKGSSLYYIEDRVTLNESDDFLISVPQKFLLKMMKKDKSHFEKYNHIDNDDFNIVIFSVENKSFELNQLFITI
jgi:hypothetical protein